MESPGTPTPRSSSKTDKSNKRKCSSDEIKNTKCLRYTKEFLIDCFKHPACRLKPKNFPIANLEITLSTARMTGKTPSAAYIPPPKKKLDLESEGISLRPHSGNFSSGCNVSPGSGSGYSRYGPDEKPDRDRERNFRDSDRGTSRFNNTHSQRGPEQPSNGRHDRDRNDKERGRGRDDRDYLSQPINRAGNRRTYNMMPDLEDGEWDRRRRPARHGVYEREYRLSGSGRSDSGGREEEEPLWFSEPMSRHDTIELTGGPPDLKGYSYNCSEDNVSEVNGWSKDHNDSETEQSASRKDNDDFSGIKNIDKILELDQLSSFFTDSASTSKPKESRYSEFFKSSNHESTVHKAEKEEPGPSNRELVKNDALTKHIGESLRSLLLSNPQPKSENSSRLQEEWLMDGAADRNTETHRDNDHHAFGNMVNQLFQKASNIVKKGNEKVEVQQVVAVVPIEETVKHQSNLSLPRSRPSSNGASTVHEIYNDPLHPFTRLVKNIHNGIPLDMPEFVPAHANPERPTELAVVVQQQEELPRPSRPVPTALSEFQAASMPPPPPPENRYMAPEVFMGQHHPDQSIQQRQPICEMPPQQLFMGQTPRFNPPTHLQLNNGSVSIPVSHRNAAVPIYRAAQQMPSSYPQVRGYMPMAGGSGQYVAMNSGGNAYGHGHGFGAKPGNAVPVTSQMQGVPSSNGQNINPLTQFNDQLRNNASNGYTPGQVLSYLPPDVQSMLSTITISPELVAQQDNMIFLSRIKSGEISLIEVMQQVCNPQSANRQLVIAALKLGLQGVLPIRGLSIPSHLTSQRFGTAPSGQPSGSQQAQNSGMGVPQQRQHQQYGMGYPPQRPQYQSEAQRGFPEPGPPLPRPGGAHIQFTPTAVMSYMSAASSRPIDKN